MRILFVLTVFAFVFVVGCSKSDPESPQETTQAEDAKVEETLIYYTCPMESHKHVHSDQPGKCPECQMELARAVVTSVENKDFYGCPMEAHSHVRSDESGTCPECSMTLKPMRLDKNKT